jgi:hypothetical protein
MKKVFLLSLALGVTLGCGLLSRVGFTGQAPQVTPSVTEPETAAEVPEGTLVDEEDDPFAIPVTDTPDPDALAESVEITGTITGMLDGREMTWQTGLITTRKGEGSLAYWSPFPLGVQEDLYMVRIISIPASRSFDVEGDAPQLGARLEIEFIFSIPTDGQQLSYTITEGEPMTLESADILLFQDEGGSLAVYEMMDGRLEVSVEQADPGSPAAFTGTFQGILAFLDLEDNTGDLDPSRTLEISGGTFDLNSVVFQEE